MRPNQDSLNLPEELAVDTKAVHQEAVVASVVDFKVVWEEVVEAVKSMSPTFVTSFPFLFINLCGAQC